MIDGKQIKPSSIRESRLNIQDVLNFNNNRAINMALPLADKDGANKRYVDAIAQGLIIKNACILSTNTSSDLTGFVYSSITDKWTNVVNPTFDGVALTDLDRVLIKNDTANSNVGNGIWIFYQTDSEFRRAEDADNVGSPLLSELRGGSFVFVTSGTNNADTGWVISSPNKDIILGTNPIVWTQFSGAGVIGAGDGLSKSGNILNVNVDNVGVEIFADQIRLKAGGITGDKFNSSVAGDGLSINGTTNALDINVDDVTIELNADAIQIKDGGITVSKFNSNVFGDGFSVGANVSLNINNAFEFDTTQLALKLNPNNSLAVTVDGVNSSTNYEEYTNPAASSGGTDFNTGITVPDTPAGNSVILVYLNGIKSKVSYGDKTGEFWFEPSGGGTARASADIVSTDELHFNPTLAAFDLETDDEIELVYNKIQ